MTNPLLIIHVSAAAVGLISGAVSMFLRKGTDRHRIAGSVFFGSMLIMTSSATYLAIRKPSPISVVVGILTFYLVATAWVTARRRNGGTSRFDLVALLLALTAGVAGYAYGFERAGNPSTWPEPIPAGMYFFFGSISLLFVLSDVRTYVRGGVTGTKRIRRHLWRMCLALLIAFLSFYPGQAKLFPAAWRATNLLFTPLILFAGMTIFWLVRMSSRKAVARMVDDRRLRMAS